MSLRLEMLQVARLAPKLLGDSSELVLDYLRSKRADDGGYPDREGKSDLYYTVFGLEGRLALQEEDPRENLNEFLDPYGVGNGLDLVHLSCLARCHGVMPGSSSVDPELKAGLLHNLEAFRTPDGGFHGEFDQPQGTVYGCFMALGMCQDLGVEFKWRDSVLEFLKKMETPDGGYANEPSMVQGNTPATSAAVSLLHGLEAEQRPETGEWLKSLYHEEGGFFALKGAPMPDLLSTAVALHALSTLRVSVKDQVDSCLDFIDTLWTNKGSFHGNWVDNDLDVEYTYYGLLALGHLAVY